MVTRLSRPGRGDERGFSLIELMMASLVGALTLSAAIMLTSRVSKANNSQLDNTVAQEEARYAMDAIIRTLRTAGSNPYGITTTNCPSTNTAVTAIRRDPNNNTVMDDIRVQADVNPPNGRLGGATGSCTELDEDITIAHNAAASTITRLDNNVGGTATPITDTVITLLRFTYLDVNRAVTTVEAAITYIQISITTTSRQREATRMAGLSYTMTSEVRVRTR